MKVHLKDSPYFVVFVFCISSLTNVDLVQKRYTLFYIRMKKKTGLDSPGGPLKCEKPNNTGGCCWAFKVSLISYVLFGFSFLFFVSFSFLVLFVLHVPHFALINYYIGPVTSAKQMPARPIFRKGVIFFWFSPLLSFWSLCVSFLFVTYYFWMIHTKRY